ncbi:MAG: DUF3781 domain-containing protein [Ruminococcus flavefaciens]|nr:DUF3781 domain-containing protein [Ruminococcus flavefaciens]
MNELLENIDRLHTTELGIMRIKRNLSLDSENAVGFCRKIITDSSAVIEKSRKNWYTTARNCRITVNSYSYTIITSHEIIS